MKILFVVPESGRKFAFPRRHGFFDLATPLLAAMTPSSIEVEIVDANVEHIDYGSDADVVMITVPFSPRAERAYDISRAFRERGKTVVMGGAHTWFFPEEALAHADSVVVGEAEPVWAELLEDLRRGTPKRSYQGLGVLPLKDDPMPRYDLLKLDRYLVAPIQTTRGCPYHCKFCAMWKYQGDRLRHKDVDRVVEEIRLIKKHPFRPFDWLPFRVQKLFFFLDLNFCIDAKYTLDLLERLRELKISYYAQTSFSSIAGNTDRMVELLAESGCKSLSLGIESLEDADLLGWNSGAKIQRRRGLDRNRLGGLLEQLHDAGIDFHANLMFGADGHDLDYFEKVEEFMERHHILGLQPSILYPYPKTEMYDEWEATGKLRYYPKNAYNMHASLLHEPALMSRETFAEQFVAFLGRVNAPAEVLKRYEYVVRNYSLDPRKRTGMATRLFCILWLGYALLKHGVDLRTIARGSRVMLTGNDIRPLFCVLGAALLNEFEKVFSRTNILLEYDTEKLENPRFAQALVERARSGKPEGPVGAGAS